MVSNAAKTLIRVGLCNPNQSIRAGKSMLINSQTDMQVVYEASTYQEVLHAVEGLTIDVLIIDHRLSGHDGIWLVETVNRKFFERREWPPTMIITAPYFAVELDIAVMRSGAADFVVEESGAEQLLSAIRTVTQDDQSIDTVALRELFVAVNLSRRDEANFNLALDNLDAKARAVLEDFDFGLVDSAIAENQQISALRVRQLFRRILIHFGFTTREQLALALFESGRLIV